MRALWRRLVAQALTAAVLVASVPAGPAGAAPPPITLPGHVPTTAVGRAQDLGPLAAGTPLSLTVSLAVQHPEALQALLRALSTPGDPLRGHYLTPAQFARNFGATDAQLAAVTAFLRGQGLSVGAVAPGRLRIRFSGSAERVERAFGVPIERYRGPTGADFYAPASDPRVPAALGGIVRGVQGLDNVPRAHPLLQRSAVPRAATPVGLTPAAVRTAYDLTPAYANGLDGSGQTLAVFELDGYTPADIAAYEQQFGLRAVPVQNILVDGATGTPGGGAAQVTLDLELQVALAPGASRILVYEGPNTAQGVLDTYAQIADDDLATAVSAGWGQCELNLTPASRETEETIFEQMAAQGQSLFAATGDQGAAACTSNGASYGVQDPASDPWVTAVGGTHLNLAADGSYGSETAWVVPCGGYMPCPVGGGGGESAIWQWPVWQQAPNLFPVARQVPDVSLDADPTSGYAMYFDGAWSEAGGTSAAAALWAGWAALANQYAARQGAPRLGFAAPTLYQIARDAPLYAADLHDVTQGNNGEFGAETGYDLATGLGSMDGWNLLRAVGGPAPAPPVITGVRTSSGPAAGGTSITVEGYNLQGADAVRFGAGAAATFTVISDTAISAVTPPEAAGVVDITVTTPAGTSTPGGADHFDFLAPPVSDQSTAYQIDAAHDGVAQFATLAAPLLRRWSTDLGGRPSYPLIAAGKVFAVVEPSGAVGTELVALDEATGAKLWGPIALDSAEGWSAPTYDGGRVFTLNSVGRMAAFDANSGAILWSQSLPGQWSFTSPPTAVGGIVYVGAAGAGGTVYAVNGANGALLWTAPVQNGDNSSPAVTADGVYVSYTCDQTYKFDPVNGLQRWHYAADCEGSGGETPVYSSGLLYVRDPNVGAVTLDAQYGTKVGTFSAGPPPAFAANTLVALNGATLSAVDLTSNASLWTFTGDGGLQTAPVIVNQTVFEGSASGVLYAVDLRSGALLWTSNAGAAIPPDAGPYSRDPPPGIGAGDGMVIVPAGSALVAYASTVTASVGGRDLMLDDRANGQLALGWNGGTTQTGYAVARLTPGGAAILPSAGPLPATATSFTDAAVPTAGYDCYAVAPLNGAAALALSDVLCAQPGSRAGPAAPVNVAIRLDGSNTATLTWTPVDDSTSYQLLAVSATTERAITLTPGAITVSDDTGGQPTCYALVATGNSPAPGNSDILCAVPGVSTLQSAAGPRTPAAGLAAARAALERANLSAVAARAAHPVKPPAPR